MSTIALPERGMEVLFGTHDENLRFLEQQLKVRIRSQGNELYVEGEEQGIFVVRQVFEQLTALMKDGYSVARATCAWPRSSWSGTAPPACATTS